MKLHQESQLALNTVTGYGIDYVDINLERHFDSLIVMPEAIVAWPARAFDLLTPEDFDWRLEPMPELVIVGTGMRARFAHPRLTAPLTRRRIGIESMDLGAACRTYNVLMGEGRKVAAALLIESR